MADPGLQEGGAPTPDGGAPTNYLAKFLPKTARKGTKLDREGPLEACAPLDPLLFIEKLFPSYVRKPLVLKYVSVNSPAYA